MTAPGEMKAATCDDPRDGRIKTFILFLVWKKFVRIDIQIACHAKAIACMIG
jgi:hypothetical protein